MKKRNEPQTQTQRPKLQHKNSTLTVHPPPIPEAFTDQDVKKAFTTFISHEKSFSLLLSLFQIMLLLSPSPSVTNKKEIAELHTKVLELWYENHDQPEPIQADEDMETNTKSNTHEPEPVFDGSY
jgi:hypothetical protein